MLLLQCFRVIKLEAYPSLTPTLSSTPSLSYQAVENTLYCLQLDQLYEVIPQVAQVSPVASSHNNAALLLLPVYTDAVNRQFDGNALPSHYALTRGHH